MTNTAQWSRARADVRKRTSRTKGRTSTRVTGRGELSTLIGAREAHEDAGRVPMAVVDHALDSVRETAHGADGDALARLADRWALAIGAELPALIGNERNSWSEAGTMPTDPAILASIAATTCGITGGINPRVDALLSVHVSHKYSGRTFPARLRVGAYVKRTGETRRTVTAGRRTIRPDIWRDPVTETVRPRLKWTIHELPAIGNDIDHVRIGHGANTARVESARQQRTDSARVTRDSVKVNGSPEHAVQRTYEHAMRHDDPSGRWEWRADHDVRGVLSIARSGKMSLSGSGYRADGRTIKALLAKVHEQTAI